MIATLLWAEPHTPFAFEVVPVVEVVDDVVTCGIQAPPAHLHLPPVLEQRETVVQALQLDGEQLEAGADFDDEVEPVVEVFCTHFPKS